MTKKKKNIIRYRKPWNLNIGVIIFLVVFVYLLIIVFRFASREKVRAYEVTEGTMASVSDYTGLILRSETVVATNAAGYLNYYIREGSRASVGSLVYTLDETGSMSSLLAQSAAAGSSLSPEYLDRLKGQLSSFSSSYDPMHFEDVYNVRSGINSSLLEYLNASAMEELAENLSEEDLNFQKIYAHATGIVEYYIDGFENMRPEEVSKAAFDTKSYQKTSPMAGTLVESGSLAYKLITDDTWSVLFQITQEDLARLQSAGIVSVTFKGTGLSANGEFEVVMGSDGTAYGKLTFYKYMVQFANDRYLDIELNLPGESGLKIPVSSVVSKAFYLIPTHYLTKGNNSTEDGFLKEVYGPSGTSTEFCSPTLYYEKDGYYYVDTDEFSPGEYLVLPDSEERYQIGQTASLQGVYNINKGYAVFKQIEILESNDEYLIVRKNMPYGLSVYDHIILNGDVVSENDLIYE